VGTLQEFVDIHTSAIACMAFVTILCAVYYMFLVIRCLVQGGLCVFNEIYVRKEEAA